MSMHENDIRDALATRLDLLEPGLKLVALEYRLPNRAGTAGRIDILARDTTGCVVVIELKRTDTAAQTAFHELAKYVELLQREKGIGPADVRAVIAAVHWRELLVPFSKAARAAGGGLTGYQLVLDTDMVTPVAAQRIQPLDEVAEPVLSDQQLFIQSESRSLDDAWKWATDRFGSLGVADLVGFEFSHPLYAPGLYVALASRRDGDAVQAMANWGRAPHGFTVESGHPHALASLHRDASWTLNQVRRLGVYADATLFRDEDLVVEASIGGLSDVKYVGTARSSYAPRWTRFRSRIRRSLSGNDAWTATVERWLDTACERSSEVDLYAHVFNPCDLATAICFGWPERFTDYVPSLIFLASVDGGRVSLHGTLVAVERGHDANSAFDLTYGDVGSWFVGRAGGDAWAFDPQFLRLLGLRYAIFEKDIEGAQRLLEWKNGVLVGRSPDSHRDGKPVWQGIKPLSEWANRHRTVIGILATRMRVVAHVSSAEEYS